MSVIPYVERTITNDTPVDQIYWDYQNQAYTIAPGQSRTIKVAKTVDELTPVSAEFISGDATIPFEEDSESRTITPDRLLELDVDLNGLYLWDHFQRDDTVAGVLGTPSIGSAWSLVAAGGVTASTVGRIENREFTAPVGSVVYAIQDLPTPPGIIGSKIKFTNAGGATYEAGFAIGLSTMASGSRVSDMVHVVITRNSAVIQSGFYPGGTTTRLVTHGELQFPTALSYDTSYPVILSISGSRAVLRVGPYTVVAEDPRISINHGRHVFWEHFYSGVDAISKLTIQSAFAAVGKSSISIPRRVVRPSLRGAFFARGASNKARANFSSLTEIGTGDFTFVWCGTVPGEYRRGSGTTLVEPNAAILTTSTTGANNATGPLMGFDAAGGIRFRIYSAGAAGYIDHRILGPTRPHFGQPIQFAAIRRSGVLSFWINGEPAIVKQTTSGTPPTDANFVFTGKNLFLGPAFSDGAANFSGTFYYGGLLNYAATGKELAEIDATSLPPVVAGGAATNTPLTASTMAVGSTYVLGTVGTANYYYSACAAGDRVLLFGTSGANSGVILGNDALIAFTNVTINASNPVTLLGAMVWLVAGSDQGRITDVSGNGNHATLDAGTITLVEPKYLSGAGAPSGVVLPRWIGDDYFDTSGAHFYKATGLLNTNWKQTTV